MQPSFTNITLSFAVALVLHEAGHFLAARACRVKVNEAGIGWGKTLISTTVRGVGYRIRILPLGAYVRMDMIELQTRPLIQQIFVLLAGVGVNVLLGWGFRGTFFGLVNMSLALMNLFPIYQQDGWKTGMVMFRRLFNRPSPFVEWSFTISFAVLALALLFWVFMSV
jgi:membrane-associated protease RseP (regulator of RpoE activity)